MFLRIIRGRLLSQTFRNREAFGFVITRTDCRTFVTSAVMGKSNEEVGVSIGEVVEVEQRFPFGAETENNLIKAGASLISEKSFKDDYMDTKDYRLTGADHWLRLRDGVWQLKYPSPVQLSNNAAAEYIECEKEETIHETISSLLSTDNDDDTTEGVSALEALSKANLHSICSFETRRKKFHLDGVVIDLDSTCYGFAIGEMEVLVQKTGNCEEDANKHRQALESIRRVADKLGVSLAATRREGKVTKYLRNFRKDHYDFLLKRGVLKIAA